MVEEIRGEGEERSRFLGEGRGLRGALGEGSDGRAEIGHGNHRRVHRRGRRMRGHDAIWIRP